MRRPCYVVDSFAAQALAGNPAGVLLDGADLDSRSMQRIAGELKHSETAFPLPAREPIYDGHPWLLGPVWAFAAETAVHALRLMASGLFDRYPRLQIVLGHLGEGLPYNL